MGSVGAWVRGWSESNFARGCVGRVGPQSFDLGQKMAELKFWGGSNI